MAISDHIKPVATHKTPPWFIHIIKTLRPDSPSAYVSMVQNSYETLCNTIEKALRGEGVAVNEEEAAGEYVSHLLIDAAVLHNALMKANIFVGEFPYNEYADKLFPKEEVPVEDDEVMTQVIQ